MSKPSPFPVIALASLSLVSLEIVWTRIFSAEFYYMFAFLILSLAVLGLGLGGLALRIFPRLQEPRKLGLYLLLTAILALASPILVLHLGLEFTRVFSGWAMFGRLVLTILLLSSAFGTGGMVLSLLFRGHHPEMPRLYRADLLGAALGVALAILLMNGVGTPATTLLLALPLALAAFLAGGTRTRVLATLAALSAIALLPYSARLIAKPRQNHAPVIYTHWDAMALIKILDFPGARGINIDNSANTAINAFDGNVETLRRESDPFMVDPKPLMDAMGGTCTFMSIGSGGGGDVLMALQNGAREIHAVEVNPTINRMLTKGGMYADYSGRIYDRPEVRVVTEDARAYLRRFDGKFDIIYSLSSNTFAALASGAFALAENYVFTSEAFQDYYRALSPRGFLVMEHQFYMPRVVSEALEGMKLSGVTDPEKHIAVYTLPGLRRQVLVLGKAPLSPEVIQGALRGLETRDFHKIHRVYPNPDPGASPTISRIVKEGWRKVGRDLPVDISPSTDDRPFIAQQGLLKNVHLKALKAIDPMEFRGYPLSKLIVLAILGVVLLLVVPLNLLPYLQKGPKLKARGWLYFFAIGLGFMALEIVLIQQYTLFIGASAYSLVAILFTLLIGSGLGSRFAPRFGGRIPFLAILAWLLLDILLFGHITHAAGTLTMLPRILITAILVAPLGFFMGMPFPQGALRVGELIDWGFAVNGAASVLGSAAIMLVSFTWGFTAALAAGGVAYLLAMILATGSNPWVREA